MSRRMLVLLTAVLVAGMIAVVWGAKAPEKKAAREGGHRHEHREQGHRHDHEGHAKKRAPAARRKRKVRSKRDTTTESRTSTGTRTTTRKSHSSA
jgi:hypothetical protein